MTPYRLGMASMRRENSSTDQQVARLETLEVVTEALEPWGGYVQISRLSVWKSAEFEAPVADAGRHDAGVGSWPPGARATAVAATEEVWW